MSNVPPINATGIVGIDGVAPIYNPNGKWQIWNMNAIYTGADGTNMYVPLVGDEVHNIVGTTIDIYIVTDINPLTLVATLTQVTDSNGTGNGTGDIPAADILYGTGTTTQPSTFVVYYDNSTVPYRLAVDARLRVAGSMCQSAKIFLGNYLSTSTDVISLVLDSSGNIISESIPLELVATDVLNNVSIKVVPPAFTNTVLTDGELVTIVFYDSMGGVVSKQQLLVEGTSWIVQPNAMHKYITSIVLESPFISSSNANLIQFPLNLPLSGLDLQGVVNYSDGSKLTYPVDNTKFTIYGLEGYMSSQAGQTFDVVLKYTLGPNESSMNLQIGASGQISTKYEAETLAVDNAYMFKLYGFPNWVSDSIGYTLQWFLYDMDRAINYDVTNLVNINTNFAPFQPKAYGILQTLNVSIDVSQANPAFQSYVHAQTIEFVLNGVGNESGYYPWSVAFAPGQTPRFSAFALGTHELNNNLNWTLDITNGIANQTEWLNALYFNSIPLTDPSIESTPPTPSHFNIISNGYTTRFPISSWNNLIAMGNGMPEFTNIIIEFVLATNSGDLQLSCAALPVMDTGLIANNTNNNGSVIGSNGATIPGTAAVSYSVQCLETVGGTTTLNNDASGNAQNLVMGNYLLQAIVSAGYIFANWSIVSGAGNCQINNFNAANTSIYIDGNVVIQANYTTTEVSVQCINGVGGLETTVETNGSGAVLTLPLGSYPITATPEAGFTFAFWTITGNATVTDNTGNFTPVLYNSSGAPIPGDYSFDTGTETLNVFGPCTVTAVYHSPNITIEVDNGGFNTTVTLTGDNSTTLDSTLTGTDIITVTNYGNYTIGLGTAVPGEEFVDWTITGGNGEIAVITSPATTLQASANVTVQANFNTVPYMVNLTVDSNMPYPVEINGTVIPLGSTVSMLAGSYSTLFSPNDSNFTTTLTNTDKNSLTSIEYSTSVTLNLYADCVLTNTYYAALDTISTFSSDDDANITINGISTSARNAAGGYLVSNTTDLELIIGQQYSLVAPASIVVAGLTKPFVGWETNDTTGSFTITNPTSAVNAQLIANNTSYSGAGLVVYALYDQNYSMISINNNEDIITSLTDTNSVNSLAWLNNITSGTSWTEGSNTVVFNGPLCVPVLPGTYEINAGTAGNYVSYDDNVSSAVFNNWTISGNGTLGTPTTPSSTVIVTQPSTNGEMITIYGNFDKAPLTLYAYSTSDAATITLNDGSIETGIDGSAATITYEPYTSYPIVAAPTAMVNGVSKPFLAWTTNSNAIVFGGEPNNQSSSAIVSTNASDVVQFAGIANSGDTIHFSEAFAAIFANYDPYFNMVTLTASDNISKVSIAPTTGTNTYADVNTNLPVITVPVTALTGSNVYEISVPTIQPGYEFTGWQINSGLGGSDITIANANAQPTTLTVNTSIPHDETVNSETISALVNNNYVIAVMSAIPMYNLTFASNDATTIITIDGTVLTGNSISLYQGIHTILVSDTTGALFTGYSVTSGTSTLIPNPNQNVNSTSITLNSNTHISLTFNESFVMTSQAAGVVELDGFAVNNTTILADATPVAIGNHTLAYLPQEFYTFDSWVVTGNATINNVNNASTNININGDCGVSVTTTYANPNTVTLFNDNALGSVTFNGTVYADTTVGNSQAVLALNGTYPIIATVGAADASTMEFLNWSVSGAATIDNITSHTAHITITGNCTLLANYSSFSSIGYSASLDGSNNPEATVTVNGTAATAGATFPGAVTVQTGTVVPIVATPEAGYVFSHWVTTNGGTIDNVNNESAHLTVNGNVNLQAICIQLMTVGVTQTINYGTVPLADQNADVTNQGHPPGSISINGVVYDTTNGVNTNISLPAGTYPLVVSVFDGMVFNEWVPLNCTIDNANIVTVNTPVPYTSNYGDDGLVDWQYTQANTGISYGLTIQTLTTTITITDTTNPISLNVIYNKLTVTLNQTSGGTTYYNASTTVVQSTNVQDYPLFAIPASGFVFNNWIISSGHAEIDNVNSPGAWMLPTGDTSIVVEGTFLAPITIDNAVGAATTINNIPVVNTAINLPAGTYPITTTVPTGYTFVNWSVNSGSGSIDTPNDITANLTVITGCTIAANFSSATGNFTVTPLTNMPGVTISLNGNTTGNVLSLQPTPVPLNGTVGMYPLVATAPAGNYYFSNWIVTGDAAVVNINGADNMHYYDSSTSTTVPIPLTFDSNGNPLPGYTGYNSSLQPTLPNGTPGIIGQNVWFGDYDDGAGNVNPNGSAMLIVTGNCTVEAVFYSGQGEITIDMSSSNGEVVSISGGNDTELFFQQPYPSGTTVSTATFNGTYTISATPNAGDTFNGWVITQTPGPNGLAVSSNEYTIANANALTTTITTTGKANMNIVANFTPSSAGPYNLTFVSNNSANDLFITHDGESMGDNTTSGVSLIAGNHGVVLSVNEDGTGGLDGLISYSITSGTSTFNSGAGAVDQFGNPVTVALGTFSIDLTSDTVITLVFSNSVTLLQSVGGGGLTLNGVASTPIYNVASTPEPFSAAVGMYPLVATPAAGYVFAWWLVTGDAAVVNTNGSVATAFAGSNNPITTVPVDSNGNPLPGYIGYDSVGNPLLPGQTTGATTYITNAYFGDYSNDTGTEMLIVTGNCTVEAVYSNTTQINIGLQSTNNEVCEITGNNATQLWYSQPPTTGTPITVTTNDGTYTISAIANPGDVFNGWTSLDGTGTCTITDPTALTTTIITNGVDISLQANFTPALTLTVVADLAGVNPTDTVVLEVNGVVVTSGQMVVVPTGSHIVTATLTTATGDIFGNWSFSSGSTNTITDPTSNSTHITILSSESSTITATFSPPAGYSYINIELNDSWTAGASPFTASFNGAGVTSGQTLLLANGVYPASIAFENTTHTGGGGLPLPDPDPQFWNLTWQTSGTSTVTPLISHGEYSPTYNDVNISSSGTLTWVVSQDG